MLAQNGIDAFLYAYQVNQLDVGCACLLYIVNGCYGTAAGCRIGSRIRTVAVLMFFGNLA